MIHMAERDPKIVAITAAMPEGTGLVDFAKKFPTRFHYTGITEQHAVAFAGGLAKAGMERPVTAIYDVLQRGYDQSLPRGRRRAPARPPGRVLHGPRPVWSARTALSHGIYDIAYLRTFPSTARSVSPRDATELAATSSGREPIASGSRCVIRVAYRRTPARALALRSRSARASCSRTVAT